MSTQGHKGETRHATNNKLVTHCIFLSNTSVSSHAHLQKRNKLTIWEAYSQNSSNSHILVPLSPSNHIPLTAQTRESITKSTLHVSTENQCFSCAATSRVFPFFAFFLMSFSNPILFCFLRWISCFFFWCDLALFLSFPSFPFFLLSVCLFLSCADRSCPFVLLLYQRAAASLFVLVGLLSNVHRRFVFSHRLTLHFVFNLSCHGEESLLHVGGIFGRCF